MIRPLTESHTRRIYGARELSHGADDVLDRSYADSSLFPSSCGANPSWTIMALSHRVASRLAAGRPEERRWPFGS